MSAKLTFMVATVMLLVTILKAPTIVPASQDSIETEKTAVKVRNGDNTSACANTRDMRNVVFQ